MQPSNSGRFCGAMPSMYACAASSTCSRFHCAHSLAARRSSAAVRAVRATPGADTAYGRNRDAAAATGCTLADELRSGTRAAPGHDPAEYVSASAP